jgi:hypothetical protein
MRNLTSVVLLLAVAAFCVGGPTPSVRANDDDAPAAGNADPRRPTDLEQARRRWDSLPAEKRERLLQTFRRFQEMPVEKRDLLRERFRRMGGREGVDGLRRTMENIRERAPEKVDALRRQGERLRDLEARVRDSLPADLKQRIGTLPPSDRDHLRRRLLHTTTDAVRRTLIDRHATPEERIALEGDDEPARTNALRAVFTRAREAAMAGHRERLAGLSVEERRVESDRLFLDYAWDTLRPSAGEIRGVVEKALQQSPADRDREHAERVGRRLGLRPDAIGVPGGAKRVLGTLLLIPAERRGEAKIAVQRGIEEIAALPEPRRREALESLLRRLLIDFGGK